MFLCATYYVSYEGVNPAVDVLYVEISPVHFEILNTGYTYMFYVENYLGLCKRSFCRDLRTFARCHQNIPRSSHAGGPGCWGSHCRTNIHYHIVSPRTGNHCPQNTASCIFQQSLHHLLLVQMGKFCRVHPQSILHLDLLNKEKHMLVLLCYNFHDYSAPSLPLCVSNSVDI